MAGIWGKHPGHGDFIAAGLHEAARAVFVPWLDACLTELRAVWGPDWRPRFDAMPPLGFWFGPDLCGGTALAGVMLPSHDKVGRRYPLAVLGWAEPAPPMLSGWAFIETAEQALAALAAGAVIPVGDWPLALGDAPEPGGREAADASALIWARNASRCGAAVLGDMSSFDHAAASAGRACLWTGGTSGPGAALSRAGLPDAQALGWLIEAGARPPAEAPVLQGEAMPSPLAAGAVAAWSQDAALAEAASAGEVPAGWSHEGRDIGAEATPVAAEPPAAWAEEEEAGAALPDTAPQIEPASAHAAPPAGWQGEAVPVAADMQEPAAARDEAADSADDDPPADSGAAPSGWVADREPQEASDWELPAEEQPAAEGEEKSDEPTADPEQAPLRLALSGGLGAAAAVLGAVIEGDSRPEDRLYEQGRTGGAA